MYKVKLLKNSSLQKLEEEINKFIETLGLINGVDVNISVLNVEDAMLEYIATIIYKGPDFLV